MLNKRDTIKQAHPKDKEINLKNFHASQTVSFEDLKKQRAMTFEGKKQIRPPTNKSNRHSWKERGIYTKKAGGHDTLALIVSDQNNCHSLISCVQNSLSHSFIQRLLSTCPIFSEPFMITEDAKLR